MNLSHLTSIHAHDAIAFTMNMIYIHVNKVIHISQRQSVNQKLIVAIIIIIAPSVIVNVS